MEYSLEGLTWDAAVKGRLKAHIIILSRRSSTRLRIELGSLQSRAVLQPVRSALDIGPKEKALYLKKSVKGAPAQAGEPDSTTLGGNIPASLRSWLRQVDAHFVLPF
jgi:hypothetical protein